LTSCSVPHGVNPAIVAAGIIPVIVAGGSTATGIKTIGLPSTDTVATDIALAVVGRCPAAAGVVAVTSPSPHSAATDIGIAVIGATVTAAVGRVSIDIRSAATGIRAVRLVADAAGTTNITAWIVVSDAILAAQGRSCVIGDFVAAACVRAVSTADDAAGNAIIWPQRQGAAELARLCTRAAHQYVNKSIQLPYTFCHYVQ